MKSLADQLRDAVNASEWRISTIARETGIPQPNLHNFAKGTRGLTLTNASALAQFFSMKLSAPIDTGIMCPGTVTTLTP